MGTSPCGDASVALPRRRIFSRVRLLFALGLLLLFIVCVAFSWMTRDAMANLPFLNGQGRPHGRAENQNTLVDLHPWQTAQALAALAITTEEVQYAREAQRLADHEGDQAFASALRQASTQNHVLTGKALALSQKLSQLQQVVKEDQTHVQSLTQATKLSASSMNNPVAPITVTSDLDIAKAQLGLDSDQLADAQQDLARAVGDERSRIQQELAAHESAMRSYDAQSRNEGQVAVVSAQRYGTLAGRLKAWIDQRSRYQFILQAMQQAQADALALTAKHNQLEGEANAAASSQAGSISSHVEPNPAPEPATNRTAELASLKNRSAQRQLLTIYDDRIQTQQQLASVYGKWSAQVLLQHRIVLHLLLQSLAIIAFILFSVISFDGFVRHLVSRPTLDRRRTQTLRIILIFGIQFVGALLILFVIFGLPSQMPTIVGLTTAGLTVVLQDFILAFFGWFTLMSKNGIRVGDWVEINGVGGEVVEIGLFHTVMLETGNWTDKGHPTGRRVTFMNSFAIKGQYFNFSTTGQWMWDEIAVSIPTDDDTYDTIELIRKTVLEATEKDARLAEQEWKRVTRQNGSGLGQFAASPAVDMRPSGSGIAIIVRYVTRASNRFEMRNRLYQRVIDLLHSRLRPGTELDSRFPSTSGAEDSLIPITKA
jgi:small-conductance mechanosensitive channel